MRFYGDRLTPQDILRNAYYRVTTQEGRRMLTRIALYLLDKDLYGDATKYCPNKYHSLVVRQWRFRCGRN